MEASLSIVIATVGGLGGVALTLLYMTFHKFHLPFQKNDVYEYANPFLKMEDELYKCTDSPERLEELRKERWQD